MTIILDNGHGSNTPGKCSPDKQVREWRVVRDIVDMLYRDLTHLGYNVVRLVREEVDVALRERCRRANAIAKEVGVRNAILISVHINATGGDGQWHSAQGFSAHVSKNASSRSKRLAKLLWDEAIQNDLKGNRCRPAEGYIVQNLAMCRDTNCPAVLTENLFMDNRTDAAQLLTVEGKKKIVKAHFDAIVRYVEEYGQ